ncbi:heavy-metal-associated domain-containing protein [Salinibacter altiplanensis]|uniref:heavy-metal-associated domain-containing protein n=1 Tax=Salinibacter altiplanensis TaxID=1803181 RepID=UPI000C9F9956|nr:heavy-metal-associated domain-containing protein [Salinibacter altiplanensis]
MTRSHVFAALFAALLVLGGLAPPTHAQDKAQKKVESPDATVYVDGLACPFCAYGLEKKMKKLGGIQKMEVQLEKGRVLLAFKKDQALTKKQIRKAVTDAGFTARKVEFTGEESSGNEESSGRTQSVFSTTRPAQTSCSQC